MEYRFTPPLTEADVRGLRAGDTVILDGTIWGIRDATQIRMFDRGIAAPVDLHGAALLHVAPNVRKTETGYEPLVIGTTTSMRMDRFTEGLLRDYGVRAIIGKGGLSDASSAAFASYGGVYLAIVGGAIFGFQLGTWFSVAMIGFAGAAVLYDTSNIIHYYPEDRYVSAAMQLFASIALMFWYVLRLLMGNRN